MSAERDIQTDRQKQTDRQTENYVFCLLFMSLLSMCVKKMISLKMISLRMECKIYIEVTGYLLVLNFLQVLKSLDFIIFMEKFFRSPSLEKMHILIGQGLTN